MMSFRRKAVHDRIRSVMLLIIAASLPCSLLAVNNIAIILLGVNWLFENSFYAKWQRLKQAPTAILFIQLYVLYLIGLSYSENIHQGGFELEKKLGMLLFPLILFTSEPITKKEIYLTCKAFIISCVVATVICYAYAVSENYREGHTLSYVFNALFNDIHLPGRYYYFNYWYFTYELFAKPLNMHPVYFSMYLVFSCCLAVWLWWDTIQDSRKKKIAFVVFILYMFITVILLASRTQLFILVILVTGFILYRSYKSKKLMMGITSVILVYALGLAFILINPVSRERFIDSNKPSAHFSDNKYGEGGLSLRRYKWNYSMETIEQSPIIGTGTGDAQDRLQETYRKNEFKIGYENTFNTHNQFLQVTLELGLIGLVSFLVSLLVPLYRSIKQKTVLYTVFMIVFMISCLTESMLEANKGIIFYAFFNALLFSYFMLRKEEAQV